MDNKPAALMPLIGTEALFAVIGIYKEMLIASANGNQEAIQVITDIADAVTGTVILELNKAQPNV
jgi:hypothetical protein